MDKPLKWSIPAQAGIFRTMFCIRVENNIILLRFPRRPTPPTLTSTTTTFGFRTPSHPHTTLPSQVGDDITLHLDLTWCFVEYFNFHFFFTSPVIWLWSPSIIHISFYLLFLCHLIVTSPAFLLRTSPAIRWVHLHPGIKFVRLRYAFEIHL